MNLAVRYGLNQDKVTLDETPVLHRSGRRRGPLPAVCDPLKAGRYLCDALGKRITSIDRLFARLFEPQQQHAPDPRPPADPQPGFRRPRRRRQISADPCSTPPNIWTRSPASSSSRSAPRAAISTASTSARPPGRHGPADRPLLPRRAAYARLRHSRHRPAGACAIAYDETGNLVTDRKSVLADDALGGRAYYNARVELEIPLGPSLKELGLRPSIFADAGALFGADQPASDQISARVCADSAAGTTVEVPPGARCPGQTPVLAQQRLRGTLFRRHRPSAHLGRLRGQLELAFRPVQDRYSQGALVKAQGDDTKLLTFNVGTAF